MSEYLKNKTGRSPEELYQEREARIRGAIELRESDRVPVLIGFSYFPYKYAGVPASTAYYDAKGWKEAIKKTVSELEPDCFRASSGNQSGLVLEALDTKQIRWPGFGLDPNVTHQFVEGEYMKEDEYDQILSDPSDYILRTYLPRVFGALAPLSKLPPLRNFNGTSFTAFLPFFATSEFRQVAEILYKAGQVETKWREEMSTLEEEMAALGFPPHGHGVAVGGAPFDVISDNLRGMRGAMIDMYRRPQQLLELCDKILEWRIARAVPADPKKRGNPKRIFMPLHRGAEGFMSKKQFETFYWPGLKKAILATIDLGYVPMPFFEGRCDSVLEYLLELPKGSTVCHFEHTDMFRAKEVLGDHLCIMGNVPSSLLQLGSVPEVEEYCEKILKGCKKGGGLILTNGSSIDEAKPENVKAMIDSAKKYGLYS